MKRGSTLFLKIAVILMGIPVLALCIFGLSMLANNPVNPDYAHILYPACNRHVCISYTIFRCIVSVF